MQLPRQLSVLLKGRHEAAERHDTAVREQLPNLGSNILVTIKYFYPYSLLATNTNLGDAANVLLPVLRREAEVLVEPRPDVVSIQAVGRDTAAEEVINQ